MEKLYEKAKEGGYNFERLGSPKSVGDRDRALVLDPLFWQALGKTCVWGYEKGKYEIHKRGIFQTIDENDGKKTFSYDGWLNRALNFHEINLTEGWSAAVTYLQEVTK